MNGTGWFVDIDREMQEKGLAYWQPCIQTEYGCFDMNIWFDSWDACYEFIETHVAGVGIL